MNDCVHNDSHLVHNFRCLCVSVLMTAIQEGDEEFINSKDAQLYMDACDWHPTSKDIDPEVLKERKFYESHTIRQIANILGKGYFAVNSYAMLHGWTTLKTTKKSKTK